MWGRSRLPLSKSAFERLHKVAYMAKDARVADTFLPVGHTCFFSIDLPRYSSAWVRTRAWAGRCVSAPFRPAPLLRRARQLPLCARKLS